MHYDNIETTKNNLAINFTINHSKPTQNANKRPEIQIPTFSPEEIVTEINGHIFTTDNAMKIVNKPGLELKAEPSEESQTILTMQLNDIITQTASSLTTEWVQVQQGKLTGYVLSYYIGDKSEYNEEIYQEMQERHTSGRLYIDDIEIDVALIMPESVQTGDAYGKLSQWIVDQKDGAVLLKDTEDYYGQLRIADHNIHGFDKLKKCVENETTAVIHQGTHIVTLLLTKLQDGYNIGADLTDLNGQSIAGQNDGGICMYTCNRNGTIVLTYWTITSGKMELY